MDLRHRVVAFSALVLGFCGSARAQATCPAPNVWPKRLIPPSDTLYYQTIPPYYLRDRFNGAPNGDGTKRLKYLVENLKLDGTEFANWKLQISGASTAGGSGTAP